MKRSQLIKQLIDSFKCLPGVGSKSAQRMAYYLLEKNRQGAINLANALYIAAEKVGHCTSCRLLTELDLCELCSDPRRDKELLCVVESPADVYAIEQSNSYQGKYFVLMGHLSPLDGIGPEQLGLSLLFDKIKKSAYKEVILATNTTVEGEATAHYIVEQLQPYPVKVTRIAHGVPLGGELEYVDGSTLSHALSGRKDFKLD
ncbi:MAG: recombination mediator RecR [Pseudomonadota bacterium]